jgi:Dephospho-CoA kinase
MDTKLHQHFQDVEQAIAEQREVIVLAGVVGCGKSTVADMIEDEAADRYVSFEVSDFVRTMFADEHDDGVNDNDLGAWAAERKAEEGDDYFVRRMAETIKKPEAPHIVISGVRSPEEAVAVKDVFDEATVHVVGVWTLPDLRFERKYGAAPSADHESWDTFTDRNERELWEWGAVEFFSGDSIHEADYFISNNGDLEDLRNRVRAFLKGQKPMNENPLPYDDFEKVAQFL